MEFRSDAIGVFFPTRPQAAPADDAFPLLPSPRPAPSQPTMAAGRRPSRWLFRLTLVALLAAAVACELTTSRLQSLFFSAVDRRLTYTLDRGPSSRIRFPGRGPFDTRLGYTRIPDLLHRLTRRGFVIRDQARWSPQLAALVDSGLPSIYPEKTRAGLRIVDRHGDPVHESLYPSRIYTSFADIPPLLVRTLLEVENRTLLDRRYPHRNPSVEWKRFAHAAQELAARMAGRPVHPSGGSTLATQIEKFRHSFQGQTRNPRDKLRQMLSASLRAYLDGDRTLEAQERIVTRYLDSVPLAAVPGGGEIFGLGDGLWSWYTADFDDVNRLLRSVTTQGVATGRRRAMAQGRAFRQALSLIIAQRRPSYYLLQGRRDLDRLTDRYLELLAREGVIPLRLRDLALDVHLRLNDQAPARPGPDSDGWKLAHALRTHLRDTLGADSLYDLDHLDLTAGTTLDAPVQDAVSATLHRLADPAFVKDHRLDGAHLLDAGDPSRVIYSLTLYERGETHDVLRIQADTYPQPFNVNEGTKLDLGSTAKLRTLISYLEIIAELHRSFSGMTSGQLLTAPVDPSDPLARWAIHYLQANQDHALLPMLHAAMQRRYSANPSETFFTGGGVHHFSNFSHRSDVLQPTVLEAFRHSINLSFVRLMRDIIRHEIALSAGGDSSRLLDPRCPDRQPLLERYARREGLALLSRLRQAIDLDDREGAPSAARRSPASSGTALLRRWLITYLADHPDADWDAIVQASDRVRRKAFAWLFRTRHRNAQDRAIRIMLEADAFKALHRRWTRLGYPFSSLVPSFATALGSSADRPDALARLVGLVLDGGIRRPVARVAWLDLARGTPFETRLERRRETGVRVLPPEVARVALEAMRAVVRGGTARRLEQVALGPPEAPWVIAGKTGTGDHRYRTFDRHGREISSRPVDRAATFVFAINQRFFGCVTAYVTGKDSGEYHFTSALPVAILGLLAPQLEPLIDAPEPHPAPTQLAALH
ncbi:MAG: transglycosylase domain-containing protein [Acidobacteriota bacterium]